MTFDEWWETLSTREQNSMDRDLAEAAWEVSAMLMQERCAKKAEKLGSDLADLNEESAMKFAGGSIACAIRALENE